MAKILVTGAQGQLGQSLNKIVDQFPDHELILNGRKELDILNTHQIETQFDLHKPDIVIHAAAYTAVDMAESEAGKCFNVNVQGTKNIAEAAQKMDATLFYISSDYVYHATGDHFINEQELTRAEGVYAQSKLHGEWQALSGCEKTIIFRTAWVYSEFGHNFIKTMARLINAGKELNVVNDQIGTPTYAPNLANILLQIAEHPLIQDEYFQRIFNYADSESLSWHEFALRIRDYLGKENIINPCTTEEYDSAAPRPENSRLDSNEIRTLLQQPSHRISNGINLSLTNFNQY